MAGGEGDSAAPANMIGLEQTISREIRENIRQTLTPYLGIENFQVSVAARVNADKQQTSETIFDPESRIERSVRVVRQNELEQNRSSETAATVEQNLPEAEEQPVSGEQSSNQNERREELTNYELSSKTVTTVSDGYGVEKLSIAVLIHRNQLAATLGEDPTPEQIDERLAEIRRLVGSAAGLDETRGDTLEVSAVEFHADARELEPVPPPSLLEVVARQSGTFINAGTILLVSLLVIWFGLRPATRALLARNDEGREPNGLPAPDGDPAAVTATELAAGHSPDLIGDLTRKLERSPQKRLAQLVDFDEQRAAAILRQWIYQDEKA
jgi:flagellar M-ring protein FliF